jgi:hypothetical protein
MRGGRPRRGNALPHGRASVTATTCALPYASLTATTCALLPVLVGRLRRQLQLLVDLIEQILRLCRVARQIELVGLLSLGNLVESLDAEALCRSQIRMLSSGHVLGRFLGRGNHPYQEQNTKNSSANSVFDHEHIL